MYIKKTHTHYAFTARQSLFKVLGTQLPIKQTQSLPSWNLNLVGILTLNLKNHKSIIRNSEKCFKENTEC